MVAASSSVTVGVDVRPSIHTLDAKGDAADAVEVMGAWAVSNSTLWHDEAADVLSEGRSRAHATSDRFKLVD